MSWIHEPFRHKKHGLYKRDNWMFQAEGTFYFRNRRTGKRVIEKGASPWFKDYRDRKKDKVWAPPSGERPKGKWIDTKERAFNFALANVLEKNPGSSGEWELRAKEWRTICWRKVSEKTYKTWKKKQKKKRRKA